MTWAQWKASSYGESTEYIISGNYVENWRGNRVYRMSSGTVWAMSTDEIIRNGEYYCNMQILIGLISIIKTKNF